VHEPLGGGEINGLYVEMHNRGENKVIAPPRGAVKEMCGGNSTEAGEIGSDKGTKRKR